MSTTLIGVLFVGALPNASNGGTGAYAHALAIGCTFNVAATILATLLLFALPRTPASRAAGDSADACRT